MLFFSILVHFLCTFQNGRLLKKSKKKLKMSDNNAESFVDSSSSTLIDGFLQIGLFLGAIFQLICIFSVIFVPQKKDEIVRFFFKIKKDFLDCKQSILHHTDKLKQAGPNYSAEKYKFA